MGPSDQCCQFALMSFLRNPSQVRLHRAVARHIGPLELDFTCIRVLFD